MHLHVPPSRLPCDSLQAGEGQCCELAPSQRGGLGMGSLGTGQQPGNSLMWALQSEFDPFLTAKAWVQRNFHLASGILMGPLRLLPWGTPSGKWLQVVLRSLLAKG